MVEVALSVFLPLLLFWEAQNISLRGIKQAQRCPRVSTTQSRVLSRPVWGLTSYVLNAFLFLLVGLHLPTTVRGLSSDTLSHALFATVVLYLAMMSARWIFGDPFPYRDVILFVTSGIVILSLVVQGALLPLAVRWSAATPNPAEAHQRSEEEELQEAYTVTYHKVMDQLPQLAQEAGASPELEQKIREEWIRHFSQHAEQPETAAAASEELAVENDLRLRVIRASREQSILLRDRGVIDDKALIEMMDRYDIEEMRLVGPLHLE